MFSRPYTTPLTMTVSSSHWAQMMWHQRPQTVGRMGGPTTGHSAQAGGSRRPVSTPPNVKYAWYGCQTNSDAEEVLHQISTSAPVRWVHDRAAHGVQHAVQRLAHTLQVCNLGSAENALLFAPAQWEAMLAMCPLMATLLPPLTAWCQAAAVSSHMLTHCNS